MVRRVFNALMLSFVFFSAVSLAHANSGELLTFAGLHDQQQVGDFYNGSGLSTTPNFGVSFSSNFYGLLAVSKGGSGNFGPTPIGSRAIFINGPTGSVVTGIINVSSGFSAIQFFYTAAFQETVKIWSGANGTGTLLATINLSPNNGSCTFPAYCKWTSAGISLAGTGESVTITGGANGLGLSDITLNNNTTAIPEPSSLYLLGVGFAGMGISRLRRFFNV
jgi:hypothetical protein